MQLPSITPLVSNTATIAEFKAALTDLRLYLEEQFGTSGIANQTLDALGASFSNSITVSTNTTFSAVNSGIVYNFTNTADVTGTLTDILTTLAVGYHIIVKNSSNYKVKIKAANSTDTIDGVDCSVNGKVIPAGGFAILFSDNAAKKWYTFGLSSNFSTKIGYSNGGVIVQLTNRTSSVTTSNSLLAGQITLFGPTTLAANTTQSFTFTNAAINAEDIIIIHHKSGGTAEKYNIWCDSITNGSCKISVRNITGTISASETPTLNFAIIKGSVS